MLFPKFTINQGNVRLSAARPVRWEERKVQVAVEAHDHEFYEICLVTSGSALHVTAEGTAQVATGHVIIVSPGAVHAFAQPRGLTVINLYYLAEWYLPELRMSSDEDGLLALFFAPILYSQARSSRIVVFEVPETGLTAIRRELSEMCAQPSGEEPGRRWMSACFTKTLLLFATNYRLNQTTAAAPAFPALVWLTLAEIDRRIAAGTSLSLTDHVRRLGCTRDHLGRVFKGAIGLGPMAFFQQRRIHHACRRILDTQHTLSEIAYDLGFADEAHFNRLFQREMGLAPGQYRKKFCRTQSGIFSDPYPLPTA